MSIDIMAARLLNKLYQMRKMSFRDMTVEDIKAKATPSEIAFYYNAFCAMQYK